MDSPLLNIGAAFPPGDRFFLWGSTLCFLLGFAHTARTLATRRRDAAHLGVIIPGAGFALQTAFLFLRGQTLGRCPLTSLFEVVVFLSWAMVLFYLVVGNTYRLSPLGILTAPLACLLQAAALLVPLNHPAPAVSLAWHAARANPWLEFHAAFSVLSFGAFALAGLAGGMYLWQERQLKTHRLQRTFFQMPPIGDLGRLNSRLLALGFALLSLGLLAGAGLGTPNTRAHLLWAVALWLLYGFLVQARWGAWRLAPRRVASLSVLAFTVDLLTLGGLSFVGL